MTCSRGCQPDRLVGVYDADGGIRGELNYILNKVMHRGHCSLCDITHGWNPAGKASFRRVCNTLPIQLELIHRDEVDDEVRRASQGRSPVVVAMCHHSGDILIDERLLESCHGDPRALKRLIQLRLDTLRRSEVPHR